jgi:hypothetical protein
MKENEYVILKNGKPTDMHGSISVLIDVVRSLESNINRQIEHSPYTIVKIDKITQTVED